MEKIEAAISPQNGKKILIVDDESDIIVYLETLLGDGGYSTVPARSAREALEVLQGERPGLICLDLMMPKKSGIALYRDLKLNPDLKDIPVIFISAFSLARDFYGKGFRKLIPGREVPEPEAYIEKPIQAERLLEAVRELIG